MGIDIGSLSCDAVVIDNNSKIIASVVLPTGARIIESIANVRKKALETAGIRNTSAEITMVPDANVALDENKTRKALHLIENLDDHDDVQAISTNLDIPDDFDFDAE